MVVDSVIIRAAVVVTTVVVMISGSVVVSSAAVVVGRGDTLTVTLPSDPIPSLLLDRHT